MKLYGMVVLSGALLLAHGALGQGAEYRLRPGDVVRILVTPQGGIYSRAAKVTASGNLYYPVVGEVRASGMTIPELTRLLQEGLGVVLEGHRVTIRPLQLTGAPPVVAGAGAPPVRPPAAQPAPQPTVRPTAPRASTRGPAAVAVRRPARPPQRAQAPAPPPAAETAVVPEKPLAPGPGERARRPLESLEPEAAQRAGAAALEALRGGRLASEGLAPADFAALTPARAVGQGREDAAFVFVPHAALLREQPVPEDWQRLPLGVLLVRGLSPGAAAPGAAAPAPAAPAPAGLVGVEGGPGELGVFFLVARRTAEGGVLEAYGRGPDPVSQSPLSPTPAGQDLPIAFLPARSDEVGIDLRLPGRVSGAVWLRR